MSSSLILSGRGSARRAALLRGLGRRVALLEQVLVAQAARLASLLSVCLGAGCATYLLLRSEPNAWTGALLVGAGGGAALAARMRGHAIASAVALCVLAFGLGFWSGQFACHRAPPVSAMPKKAVLVSGRLLSVDVLADGARRVRIATPELQRAPGRRTVVDEAEEGVGGAMDRDVNLRLRAGDAQELGAGEMVRVRALLRDPPPPDRPGGRDLQREAFFDRLGGQGYALGDVSVIAPAAGGWSDPAMRVRRLREAIAARIGAVLPDREAAVAQVMLTGLGTGLPQAERDAFAASGLAHLLAVAGLHIGIVMGVVLAVVRPGLALFAWVALRWPCREIAALAALGAGAGYMVLTGMHIPILRSFAMACLVTLALVLGRRALSMRGLALAASVILLAAPDDVLDVGFQMSFSAVAALIAGYEALRGPMLRLHGAGGPVGRLRHHLAALALTSLLAGAASAPFALYHFGRVQPFFILANLAAVPLTAMVVMPAGMLGLLLMPLGLDRPALWVMGHGIEGILWLAHAVAALPAASVAVPSMPGWGLAAVALGLAWLCIWPGRSRLLGGVVIAAGLASPALTTRPALLVSGDAGMIGLAPERPGGTLWVEQGRADRVIAADWQRAWAARRVEALPVDGSSADGQAACDPASCTITRDGISVLLVRAWSKAALPEGACDGIALLVSPTPAPGACPGVPRIDRFTVWRDGPQAVWISDGGVVVRSDRVLRGDRPWVPPAPFARRVQLTLPLAQAE